MCYLNCKEASQAGPEGLTEQNMTQVQKELLLLDLRSMCRLQTLAFSFQEEHQ